jgi:hypothetical protein
VAQEVAEAALGVAVAETLETPEIFEVAEVGEVEAPRAAQLAFFP